MQLFQKSPESRFLVSKPKYKNCHAVRSFFDKMGLRWSLMCVKARPFHNKVRRNIKSFTAGQAPFKISCTFVNLSSVCAFWLYIIDQINLLFVPAYADSAVMAFTFLSFIVCCVDLVMEVFSRPPNYRELINSQYCYYPSCATYINNYYVAVEAFALCMILCEILVSYGVVDINAFLKTNNSNFQVGKSNNIFNLSYLDYAVGFEAEQYLGWAYMSWSLVRFVGIARRQRQRWIRKIQRLDPEGVEIVDAKIEEALLRESSLHGQDHQQSDGEVYSVNKAVEGKAIRQGSDSKNSNDGGNVNGSGFTSSIRRRLTKKRDNKSGDRDLESPPSSGESRHNTSSRTNLRINLSMDSATGLSTNNTTNRQTPVHQQIALPKPPPSSSAKSKNKAAKASPVPYNLLTALIVHNSHRMIAISLITMILLPLFPAIFDEGQAIQRQLTNSLSLINKAFDAPGNPALDCNELRNAIDIWYFAYFLPVAMPELIKMSYNGEPLEFLLSAQVLPVRCPFQVGVYGTIAIPACPPSATHAIGDIAACQQAIQPFDAAIARGDYAGYFDLMTGGTTVRQTALVSTKCDGGENGHRKALLGCKHKNISKAALRQRWRGGGVRRHFNSSNNQYATLPTACFARRFACCLVAVGGKGQCSYIEGPSFAFEGGFDPALPSKKVATMFNFTSTIQFGAILGLIGRILLLFMIWIFSGVLQSDARQLVIRPLTRLLDIVFYYVRNPLAPTRSAPVSKVTFDSITWRSKIMETKWLIRKSKFADVDSEEYFETDQLIETISKIAAMLKKCWGVAGATIISESISSVTVKDLGVEGEGDMCFDPRGFGKSIYAIFAFVEIHEFDRLICCLKEDVINMINDVAVVVHEEVKRWGYVSSGQCNKNLGASFLMVWKIGDQVRMDKIKTVLLCKHRLLHLYVTPFLNSVPTATTR